MPIQISISNAIGARSATGAGGVDPDAQAFITAAAITDPTQQSAINTLVVDLKGYNIWTKMKAVYPFVGGTASTHKFNLKNPLDTDAAFRLVFSGGWTHSSTGATPNGTNGYADTFLNAQTVVNTTNHLSYYSRTLTVGSQIEIGVWNGGYIYNQIRAASNYYAGSTGGGTFTTTTDARGFWLGTKRSSNDRELYFNGASQNTITVNDTNNLPNANIYLGARKVLPGGADFYSNKQCAFASIGDGLTDTDATNLYTAVQAFQTTLGRSVGTQTVSDADAQAFVTAANIQDQVEANAVNNLVIGMKADGIWTKMKAVYPFVGGTASTHKFNLKDPRDLDAAYRLVFNGGWTHSSTGALPNGTNAYANSFLIPSASLTSSSGHLSIYSRTNVAEDKYDIGVVTFPNDNMIASRYIANLFYVNYGAATYPNISNTDSRGHFINNRNSVTNTTGFKNGVRVINSAQTGGVATNPIFISALNNNAVAGSFSSKQLAFASIGDGLSDTEAANFYNRVQTFNTALARQV